MLYRKIENNIKEWISTNDRTALLISGVRQSGKTTSIRNALNAEKCNYVEFNFVNQPEVVELLKSNERVGANKILALLSAFSDKPLIKNETIIFFDEVQVYKEMITIIKYMIEEGSYRYILSGSLLGIELRDLRSAPVGYMREIQMFPLDFEEYLYAVSGIDDSFISIVRESFEKRLPIDDNTHKKLMEYFFEYMVVGGMPKAVQAYIDSNDFNRVENIHKEIYPEYKRDFSQYEAENKKLKLIDTYDLIPAELNEINKRFTISSIDRKLKYNEATDSFEWMIHSGVSIPVYNVSQPAIPLLINRQRNLFKLFLSDVGLLTTIYGKATRLSLLNRDGRINYGAVYENFVAQELNTHGYKLYYFNSKKQGEIDFVIEREGNCLPIEVKSGKDYYVHSALNNVMSNADYNTKEAFVLHNGNLSMKENVVYLPIYMTMFI